MQFDEQSNSRAILSRECLSTRGSCFFFILLFVFFLPFGAKVAWSPHSLPFGEGEGHHIVPSLSGHVRVTLSSDDGLRKNVLFFFLLCKSIIFSPRVGKETGVRVIISHHKLGSEGEHNGTSAADARLSSECRITAGGHMDLFFAVSTAVTVISSPDPRCD